MSAYGRLRAVTGDVDFSWVREAVLPFEDYAVSSLVPAVFESYGRIFHPAWTRAGAPVRWDQVAAWSGATAHPLAQFESVTRPRRHPMGEPPFDRRPDVGSMPPQALSPLCEVLAKHSAAPESCFVGVWEGRGWLDPTLSEAARLRLPNRVHAMLKGPLEGVVDLGLSVNGAILREGPNVIWPADRTWFVATDVDQDSTYVGGTGRLVAALMADRRLEVWPVASTDPITWDSDLFNGS